MKNKHISNFWIGFIVAALAVGWLYWLWRRQREVTPQPLVITREKLGDLVSKPAAKLKVDEKESGSVVPDSLETIHGIGPVTAARLNEAGIRTFAQLADATPEELDAIVGSTPWDPAKWIAEARSLSS